MEEKFIQKFKEGMSQLKISLDSQSTEGLLRFVEILLKWNRVYNLTAITDLDSILTHHILDSLSIVPLIQGKRCLDVGSGAGFPGIPCALALPDKEFVLLDSNGKKTRFLTQVVAELRLHNTTVVQTRIENYQPTACFNSILVRAFASIEKILAMTEHVLCPGGEFLIMKGTYPQAELQKIGNHVKVHRIFVPGLNEERHVVCIKGEK